MDFGWEKKLGAQPRIGLAWQQVAGLFLCACVGGGDVLDRTGSEAET